MNLVKAINARPWLFTGLAIFPSCNLIILLVSLFVFCKRSNTTTSEIPDWLWCAAFSCLPLLACIVGLVLAYSLFRLLERQRWLAGRPLINIYVAFFALAWNAVFGFLGFFVFAMGFGDGPVVTTIKQFSQLFVGILTIGFPEAVLISVVVSSIATAIIIVVLEAIV